MSWKKLILISVTGVFIIVQFFQPDKNQSKQLLETDLTRIYALPEEVKVVFQKSCYDCHSNNTRYPWYSAIQPGAWFMASHIREGKAQLNFSDFGSYSMRRQKSKLKAIKNSIEEGSMPLRSYTLLHQEATLSGSERELLMVWLDKQINSLK